MVFDNGTYNIPQISRCQEYSIINDNAFELVWEYSLPSNLFTFARGDCHRLDNENTLIATGFTGNIIEIDSNNDIAWHVEVSSYNGPSNIIRIMKLKNIYPTSFNITFNNYSGNIQLPYIDIIDNNFST